LAVIAQVTCYIFHTTQLSATYNYSGYDTITQVMSGRTTKLHEHSHADFFAAI